MQVCGIFEFLVYGCKIELHNRERKPYLTNNDFTNIMFSNHNSTDIKKYSVHVEIIYRNG